MKKVFSILVLLLACAKFTAQEVVDAKIKYHVEKAQNYLDKEKALSGYYLIDKNGVTMFASPADKQKNKIEFFIKWHQIENFKKLIRFYSPSAMLNVYNTNSFDKLSESEELFAPKTVKKGLRIAIDPGHIAHNFVIGDLEKKHIIIKGDSINGIKDSIEIAEGMLTYATAILLKEKLEKEGAEVMLTRTADKCAFGKSYEQWKKEDLRRAVDSLYKIGEIKAWQKGYFMEPTAKDRDIFRVIFRDLELAKRVELINNFKPDYTIAIHYNVDETNQDWFKTTNKNFNMCFVGGSFMKGDLATKEKRFEFLRLLISDDIERSVEISSSVIKQFETGLKVPTAGPNDAKYLLQGCLPTKANGVYCRNLQLTRYVHSPIVYGETLYQDNFSECKLLNAEDDKTKNKRVQQVADAYFNGIMNYITNGEK